MKANEAPERVYISLIPSISGGYLYTTVNKDFPNAVEYTRTDGFVEKACEWLEQNVKIILCGDKIDTDNFIDDFRKYMEG